MRGAAREGGPYRDLKFAQVAASPNIGSILPSVTEPFTVPVYPLSELSATVTLPTE